MRLSGDDPLDVRPRSQRDIEQAIVSLNDVVMELVCGLASGATPTKGYAYTIVATLAEHTHKLGSEPSVDMYAVEGWKGVQ